MAKKKTRKITAGFILSWIFGVLFLLSGVSVIGQGSYISGLVIVICSAMIIPYFNKLISEKLNFEISGGVKFLLIIVIFIAIGFSMAGEKEKIQEEVTKDIVIQQPTVKKVYISKTYSDLWSVFNPSSKYTDLQRETIFEQDYRDKYIKWTGWVTDVDTSYSVNPRLYVEHRKKDMFDMGGGDMRIYMDKDQYRKLLQLRKGDRVSYSAKFTGFSDFFMTTFYLEDGELI